MQRVGDSEGSQAKPGGAGGTGGADIGTGGAGETEDRKEDEKQQDEKEDEKKEDEKVIEADMKDVDHGTQHVPSSFCSGEFHVRCSFAGPT